MLNDVHMNDILFCPKQPYFYFLFGIFIGGINFIARRDVYCRRTDEM